MIKTNLFRGHLLRIALGTMMLSLLLMGTAGAATLTVCTAGCSYSSIQAAINAASAGDTIQVQSGTYYENVNVNKRLTLRGSGMPVVDASGSGSAITLYSNGITLEGFSATGGGEAGIKVISNNNMLIGNNAMSNYYGIWLESSNNNTLKGNNANSNLGEFGGIGIFLHDSGNNTLIGNNAKLNNAMESGIGISLSYASNNKLIGNNANSNYGDYGTSTGISLSYSDNNILSGNNANSNVIGISLSSSNYNTLSGNNANSNIGNICGCNHDLGPGIGIFLSSSSNNKIIGNNASLNHASIETDGISVGGIGIFLSSSGSNTLISNNASFNYATPYGEPYDVWGIGISLSSSGNNLIYNNIFNNDDNVHSYDSINKWNVTKRSGQNIIGGSFLGGNFWANPKGTGFSQTCSDLNADGICDKPYVLDTNNKDYLPLSYKSPSISFIYPTPANGAILARNNAYINTTITEASTAFIDWNRSLVGWWRFNAQSGETSSFFRDWSSWGNNGTCSGVNCPTSTPGKFGNALNFDGVNDYVDAGNKQSLNITGPITIEVWINPAVAQEKCYDGVSGNYGVLGKVGGPSRSANWSWQLRFGAPGGCYLGFNFNANPEGGRWVTIKQKLTPGQWYHIVGTFNGTDIKSYLNGNLKDTNKISAIRGYPNRILMGNDGWASRFKGKIDEVRIHRRALSTEEIKASYNAGIYKLYRNFTNLAIGKYSYQAYAQNLRGNVNQTEKRTLTLIAATRITLTSPNGGQTWARGSTHAITWTYTGNPGTSVRIELLKNGMLNRIILASTPNDRSQSWTIPAGQAPGTDYKIRIKSTTNAAYSDTSDRYFTIS